MSGFQEWSCHYCGASGAGRPRPSHEAVKWPGFTCDDEFRREYNAKERELAQKNRADLAAWAKSRAVPA